MTASSSIRLAAAGTSEQRGALLWSSTSGQKTPSFVSECSSLWSIIRFTCYTLAYVLGLLGCTLAGRSKKFDLLPLSHVLSSVAIIKCHNPFFYLSGQSSMVLGHVSCPAWPSTRSSKLWALRDMHNIQPSSQLNSKQLFSIWSEKISKQISYYLSPY